MIVDSSAIIALVRREPLADAIAEALGGADKVLISCATWFETSVVLKSPRVGRTRQFVDDLAHQLGLEQIPFTSRHAMAAFDAWERYGRSNHPAALDFGDCVSYATAKLAGEPLLCVGGDFTLTDIESVLG